MATRFTMVVAVHLFLIRKQQVLLMRRFNTGYEDGNFSVPAGHVEADETVRMAMIREAKEEAGVVIRPGNLTFCHVLHRMTDRESIDFFFTCDAWEQEPRIGEPQKCDGMEWFPLSALPENTIPYIRHALNQFHKQEPYSEFGF